MARGRKRKNLWRVLMPGSTGAAYTLLPGAIGFFVVIGVYIDSYVHCRNTVGCTVPITPVITGELLTAVVAMLGVHTIRGALADKRNADNGIAPVPADEDSYVPPAGVMPPGVVDPPAKK